MRPLRSVLAACCLAAIALPGVSQSIPGREAFLAISAPDASGTLPKQLAWAPDGRRLTFLWDDGGPALWSLDPATGEREPLVRLADLKQKNGGEDFAISSYAWFPKGDSLLIVSGGGDLYTFTPASGQLRRLTRSVEEETEPQLSPDGARVAYVRGFDLYVMDLASGQEKALTTDGEENVFVNGTTDWVYWEEIWGRYATGFWWSPDSRRIAYYRFDERPVGVYPIAELATLDPGLTWQKYPRPGEPNPIVKVGVLDLESGKTVWMATGEEDSYLARVDWDPRGDAVAIQRLSRDQAHLDLLRCAAGDGRCSPLISESWPTWINLGSGFQFLPDGRFLWGSEESGWRRLYLHGADGRRIRQVSPDGWAIETLDGVAGIDEKGGWAVFTGYETEGLGAAQRHVVRARLTEDRWENLTPEPGGHSALLEPRTGAWVHTWNDADTLSRAEVRPAGGAPIALPSKAPSKYDPASLPKWEFLTIAGPGGVRLPVRMLKPPGFDSSSPEKRRRYPAIMFHYGGPGSQVVTNSWGSRDLFLKRMAQRGFIVASVDNQASIFFGKKGEDIVHRRFGEENLAAQLALVDHLKGTGWVDPGRIGLWGWSGGGIHTLYCILHRPGVWKAAMAGAPVTDWRLYDSVWTERYLGTPQDNPDGYSASSPVTVATNLKDHLLLVHGLADDNVHPQNTVMFTDLLIKAGIPFEQAFYPRQKHGFHGEPVGHFYARMAEFFERTLNEVRVEGVEVREGGR